MRCSSVESSSPLFTLLLLLLQVCSASSSSNRLEIESLSIASLADRLILTVLRSKVGGEFGALELTEDEEAVVTVASVVVVDVVSSEKQPDSVLLFNSVVDSTSSKAAAKSVVGVWARQIAEMQSASSSAGVVTRLSSGQHRRVAEVIKISSSSVSSNLLYSSASGC